MNAREIASGLIVVAKKLDGEDRDTLIRAAHFIAPPKRRRVVRVDPFQAIREGTIADPGGALDAYIETYLRLFERTDPTIEESKARRSALLRTRLLGRREFGGDFGRVAVFHVRALRFWCDRGKRGQWPGRDGMLPTHERLCNQRIVDAFKLGEIDRAIGKA